MDSDVLEVKTIAEYSEIEVPFGFMPDKCVFTSHNPTIDDNIINKKTLKEIAESKVNNIVILMAVFSTRSYIFIS